MDEQVTCTEAFADADRPWRALHGTLRETPFLSPEWHAAWWRRLGNGSPQIILARRGENPVALAPLVRVGGVLMFSGDDFTDVLDILAIDDAASRALARAVIARASQLVLRYVPDGGRALGVFADELRQAGAALTVDPLVVSPRVTLRQSFEEQMTTLSKKDRHELRRKMRRLESAGRASFELVAAKDVQSALDRFVGWHRATAGEKGAFLTPDREAFFRDVARAGVAGGWLRLGELRVDNRPIAVLFAIEHGRTLAAYNSAIDPAAAPLSPGILLHAHAIRDAIARGFETYDLLRGDEPYKYDLGATDLQLYRLEARVT